MPAKTLRPHQEKAIDMLRQSIRRGHTRPMLQAPTGFGKTIVAASIIRNAAGRGARCLFIVDALSLIDQTVQAFYAEGLSGIGVIQANHPMTDYSKPIQIASVQTLQRRGMPDVGLVLVDEAHCQNEWLKKIMASGEWAHVPFIGLSATPWSKGLGRVYDDLLMPVGIQELIDAGLLAPFRVFAPAHPDLSSVKTLAGDYHEGQLADVMGDDLLIADIVQTWSQLGENRPTFAFCVDRAHAKKVQGRFQAAGIGCGYIDAHTERADREKVRGQLDRGEIQVVANVGCLTKGVDWRIGCIILARPTKSEMLYVQMVGRGLRVNEGLDDCLILDHADNALRLGFVTDIHKDAMDDGEKGDRKQQERKAPTPKECAKCHYLRAPKVHVCPSCGFKAEKQSEIWEAPGNLVELAQRRAKPTKAQKQEWYSGLLYLCDKRGYKPGWVSNQYRQKFGVWPVGLDAIPRIPTPEMIAWEHSRRIAFAKRRAA